MVASEKVHAENGKEGENEGQEDIDVKQASYRCKQSFHEQLKLRYCFDRSQRSQESEHTQHHETIQA